MRPASQRRPVNHAAINQQFNSLAEIYRQSMATGIMPGPRSAVKSLVRIAKKYVCAE
jgi:hypothetical protein